MNTLSSSHRHRSFLSLTLLLRAPTNPNHNFRRPIHNYRLFSDQSWLSVPGNPLIKWPQLSNPNPNPNPNPKPKPNSSPPLSSSSQPPQNPNPDPNFNHNDFTTIRDLLKNASLAPGPALEMALERTGIEPCSSLLEAIFDHFDSSPKPLFSLFVWAEKQPGYKSSVTLFNSMINVLAKAREFDSAWSLLLDRLGTNKGPDMHTFTILIRRYARAGMPLPAFKTFEFACTLSSIFCSDSKLNLFEILLDSLCKEGQVKVASEYFDKKRGSDQTWIPSVRVYNILLNGWFRSRKLKRAEQLWLEMKKENVKPSVVTYGTLVEGYCRMRRVEMAIELVGEMKRERIEPNAIVYNPIIDALAEAGRFKEASGMMERFSVLESGPTVSTYNSLVKGFCKAGDLLGASKILKMMISRGFVPTPTTYNYFFRYFSKFGKIEEGMNLYSKMVESGYTPDRLTYHLLIKMLCEQERLNLAMQVSEEMRARGCDLDLASSTMLIHLLCKMHRFEEAFGEFEDMIRRGIVPQYLTYQRMNDELKKQGMNEMVRKLRDMMAHVPHSTKLPDTYCVDRDESRARRTSIISRAEVMSDILKTCKDPRELVKRRSAPETSISSATQLIENIRRRNNLT